MGIDLQEREAHIAAEDTAIAVDWENERGEVQLQDDGHTPIQVFITGLLSSRYRRAQAIQRGRLMRTIVPATSAEASTNSKMNGKGAEDVDLSPEAQEAKDAEVGERSLTSQTDAVAACVTGWTEGFVAGGKPLAYSHANAVRLLRAFPHMQRKLERVMDDHARFFAAVSTS
jgi:hypothetical protein